MAGDPDPTTAHPMLSARVAGTLLGTKESWTRRMFELAGRMREDGGGPVHDLSLGNPSLEPPARWRVAITELLRNEPPGMHRYMTNAGFADVRTFIAQRESRRWGLPLTQKNVVMTVGAAGALNVLLHSLVDPGEEVLVPAPFFSEYEHYCAHVQSRLVPVATGPDFALDPDAIAAAVTPRTRVLLLNSPNNPTGAVYDAAVLDALAGHLERLGAGRTRPLVVVEDAPYRDLMHDGTTPPGMLPRYPHAVHVTSHSKDLGLAGERIGYLVISPRLSDAELLFRACVYCNRTLGFVNAPALMQRALVEVLDHEDGKVDVGVYARRARRMAAGLRELGFHLPEPRAGFFLFPRLPEGAFAEAEAPDVAMTDALLAERCIVVPGTAFGVPGHLRLSLAAPDEAVEGALAAFARVCPRA